MSIRSDYDPAAHLELGRALRRLRNEGILIVGSGSSSNPLDPGDAVAGSRAFDAWLVNAVVDLPPVQRRRCLLDWKRAPYARIAHPREDHLMPLLVVVGAAENEPGQVIYREDGPKSLSSYRFGNSVASTDTVGLLPSISTSKIEAQETAE
ncbi:aromatic ring-opening dioxygenase catalytic subunit (LigB family) [Bradyrhizobium sp. AZCC 2289]